MRNQNNFLAYCVRQEAESDPYRLYLYDTVERYGEFDWSTWNYKDSETSAKHFRDTLAEIPDDAEIHLHINSGGGDVGEGVTIYNLLRQKSQAGCKLVGFVDGMAYSVAMDIAMACDEIHMGLGTSMFLHFPWMTTSGNAEELRAKADQLDALGEASVQLYMARAKDLDENELREMMRKETMLDPEACLQYGFCDVVDHYDSIDQTANQHYIERIRRLQDSNARLEERIAAMQEKIEKKEPKDPEARAAIRKKALEIYKGGR